MKNIKILTIITILLITLFWFFYKNSSNYTVIYNHSWLQVSQALDTSVSILKLDLTKVNLDFGGVQSDQWLIL